MNDLIIGISWPIVVLILGIIFLIIFRIPIVNLLNRIRVAKGEGNKWEINFDLTIDKFNKNSFPQVLQPKGIESGEEFGETTISFQTTTPNEIKQILSEEEIEESRQKAQKRLDADTEKVGYIRGKLYQLKDGRYGIEWGINLSDIITIEDK